MPLYKTKQELITALTKCGGLSYNDFVSFISSALFENEAGSVDNFKIKEWDANEPTNEGFVVTHLIDGVEYLFQSMVDSNVSEPVIGLGAWTKTPFKYVPQAWNNFGNYNLNGIVYVNDGSKDVAYQSKSGNNNGNNPTLDVNGIYWKKLGEYRGSYFPDTYGINDVVLDSIDAYQIYISNTSSNTSPLSDVANATWKLIGLSPQDVGANVPTSSDQSFIII